MFKATEEESSRSVLSTPFLVGVLCVCVVPVNPV